MKEKFKKAILKALENAKEIENQEDMGTYNFDKPAIKVSSTGLTEKEIKQVVTEVGLGFEWHDRYHTYLEIYGFTKSHQAIRTEMAERFAESLKNDGYIAFVIYQIN